MTKGRQAPAPPGPPARWPGAHVVDLARDKLALMARLAAVGDVAQLSLGPRRLVLLSHPDDVQRLLVTEQRRFRKGRTLEKTRRLLGTGLLTSEGDFHLRQRRLVQPAFHRERLAGYAHAMTGEAERVTATWQDGTTRDTHADMMHLTLAIAGRALFSADMEGEVASIAEGLELNLRMLQVQLMPFGELLEHVPLPWVRRLHRSRARMDALIHRLIAARRVTAAAGTGDTAGGDLLSMLVAARDDERDGQGMTDVQLRDELVTLLLAAHETTANALAWTWWLLSQHPVVEARLHAEVDALPAGRAAGVADLAALPFTRAVLAESMRLFPPAWIIERTAIEPFEAGGYHIRAGSSVLASQYVIHRDPRWWPEPERFHPDRWLDGSGAQRPKFAYFPFGAGTRICVGEQFAWMEGVLVLATLARTWRLHHAGAGPPVPEPLVTLRPRGGLAMRVERRGRSNRLGVTDSE